MTDKVQKIREEVERLQNELIQERGKYYSSDVDDACILELQNVTYIDSLQEEPVSEDLEEEIEEYWKNAPTGTVYFPMWEHFQIIAHHFAEWGKKQAKVEIQAQSMALAHGCSEEPVSKDLEEAALNICSKVLKGETITIDGYEYIVLSDAEECFKAGAQWQKTQEYTCYEEAFEDGAKWKKEQMMANAVEGVVHHFEKCKVASVHYNDPTGVPMAYFTSPEGLSVGDKVKIIVIKED